MTNEMRDYLEQREKTLEASVGELGTIVSELRALLQDIHADAGNYEGVDATSREMIS